MKTTKSRLEVSWTRFDHKKERKVRHVLSFGTTEIARLEKSYDNSRYDAYALGTQVGKKLQNVNRAKVQIESLVQENMRVLFTSIHGNSVKQLGLF